MALSGATTPGQIGPGGDGHEGVLRIPQSSSIAGTSPSDCLVSYSGHSLGEGLTPLQRSSRCILQPQPTERSHGIIAKMLDYGHEVSKFELQSGYYVHFRTNTPEKHRNPIIL